MKQQDTVHSTHWTYTAVVLLKDVINGQLLRILDALKTTSPFAGLQALAVADETLEKIGAKRRPRRVLKAVLVPEKMWTTALAMHPEALLYIKETPIIDDFLLPQDRFTRVLPHLAPTQERRTEVKVVGAGGIVDLGVQFVDATFTSTPVAPTGTAGALGNATYALGDIGTEVTISYVTQPVYEVIKILRIAVQPINSHLEEQAKNQPIWGYLIHPALATLLGISVPTV